MLEGFRMGKQQAGATDKSWSGKGGGKGGGKNGKGGGKGRDAPNAAGKSDSGTRHDRTCQRQGCRAAEKKQATFGGADCCFVCGLSLDKSLPVEQLVDWAWGGRLSAEKEKLAASSPAPPAAKPQSTPPHAPQQATLTADQLAARRTKRLAELKAAKEAAPPPPTALQEVTKVFVEETKTALKMAVEQATVNKLKSVDDRATQVLDSIKAEFLPSEAPLKPASEVVEGMLAKSIKAVQGKAEADQALQTTRAALATMRGGGTPEEDEMMGLLVARELRQAKEAKLLEDKAPSLDLRKSTLTSLKADYAKALQAQTDGRATGATKAKERASARLKVADEILEAAKLLKKTVTETNEHLHTVHAQRAQLKDDQGAAVLELLEERIDDIELEDVVFEDAAEGADTTATEDDRDEARRLNTLLETRLQQFQRAAATADAQLAEQNAASAQAAQPAAAATELWNDLHISFQADPDQLPQPDTVQGELLEAAARLHALLQAVPWGCALPAVQFHNLEMLPAGLHSLVGDTIWQACWRDRHHAITPQHAVPYQLLNIAKTVVERLSLTVSEAHRAAGDTLYKAAVQQSESRRAAGGPYCAVSRGLNASSG